MLDIEEVEQNLERIYKRADSLYDSLSHDYCTINQYNYIVYRITQEMR